jgi:acyl carrier protein
MALTRDELTRFFAKDLAIETDDLSDETPLYSAGIIDSFMLLSLIAFLEKRGGGKVDTADITLDNFDTIERILAYANGMQG